MFKSICPPNPLASYSHPSVKFTDLPDDILDKVLDYLVEPQNMTRLQHVSSRPHCAVPCIKDLKEACSSLRGAVCAVSHLRQTSRALRERVDAHPNNFLPLAFDANLRLNLDAAKQARAYTVNWDDTPNAAQAAFVRYFCANNTRWLSQQTLSTDFFAAISLPGAAYCQTLMALGRAKPHVTMLNLGSAMWGDLAKSDLKSARHPFNRALACLADLPSLRYLSFGHSYLKYMPKGLAALTDLEALSLRGNDLTVMPRWFSKRLTCLSKLTLIQTKLSPKAVAQLQARMPKVDVEHESLEQRFSSLAL